MAVLEQSERRQQFTPIRVLSGRLDFPASTAQLHVATALLLAEQAHWGCISCWIFETQEGLPCNICQTGVMNEVSILCIPAQKHL